LTTEGADAWSTGVTRNDVSLTGIENLKLRTSYWSQSVWT